MTLEKIKKTNVLGLIPARGGSKSIPYKNIVQLGGKPLISYTIQAAGLSKSITRLICSTDDEKIAEVCERFETEVLLRPESLAQDDTPVIDVILDVLRMLEKNEGYTPDIVALLQPTSPFLLPKHIDGAIDLLIEAPAAESVQTIASFPHNFHAFNQRVLEDGNVSFQFSEERARCYNKQTKPKFYIFGNFIATRRKALIRDKNVFASPSRALVVPQSYALDVDGPEDLQLAEWYIQQEKVVLE